MKRHAIPLLLLLNVALAAVLAWQWLTPAGELRALRWQPPQKVAPALAETAPLPALEVDAVRYAATLERPLFMPGRRPPPPTPPPGEVAAAPVDPLPDIQLLGLYGSADAGGVIARVDGQVRRLRLGESVGSWAVKELRTNAVVVARADDVRTIELRRSTGAPVEDTVAARATATASPPGRPPAAQAALQREIEQARERVRRMNALRARSGLPPLAEP